MSSDRPGVFKGDSWWASYRAHGDPFPLGPCWVADNTDKLGLPFPQRGAWAAKSLNTLVLQNPNSNFDQKLRSISPNRAQLSVIQRIVDNLQQSGEPPEGMSGSDALTSMAGGKGLYHEEPRNLANYDFSKVKVLHSQLNPRPLDSMLPAYAKSVLQKYQTLIELSNQQLVDQGPLNIKPYWDPKLRESDKEKVKLIVALANKGLITFRRKIKERIGLFFVKKKTPEWIRMVIDARRVNASHHEPPCTRLSTPRSFLDMQLPPTLDGSPLAFGIEADVNDCFYNYFTETLASWFGIDRRGSIGFWKSMGWESSPLFDDDLQGFSTFDDTTEVYPVFKGLCMGWSWSLFFANESVNFIAGGWVDRPLQQVRDKSPVPLLNGGPIIGVYVDNISIIGRTFDDTMAAAKVQSFFEQANIPLTWTQQEPDTCFETVGLIIDFKSGTIRNKPKRLWKAFLAGRELLRRRRIPTKLLEFWLGHMTSIFMITPSALSCFFDIYRYIQLFRDKRAVLWSSVRREMRLALGLLWLSSSSVVMDPIRQVDAGDSSGKAFALTTTWATFGEVAEVSKWREVWRYQPLAQTLKQAVEVGSREMVLQALCELEGEVVDSPLIPQEIRPCQPFGAALRTTYADWLLGFLAKDKTWHKTSSIATQFRSGRRKRLEVDVNTMVPPVPSKLCEAGRFTLLWRKRWRDTDWHINAKEAQVCLSSLRRTARVTELHGKLKVTLCDNLPALCCFERGRSSSFRLNRICQQAAGYQMATGIRWRLRHVESLRNPADKDSRFHETVSRDAPLGQRFRMSGVDVDSASFHRGRQSGQSSSQPTFKPCFRRGGVFLELFAGTARLSSAVRNTGKAVLRDVDITNGSHHDLRRRATQCVILHWLQSGFIRFVHMGTPCTVFSRARHFLRNLEKARERERTGLEFALFTAEVITVCNRYGIQWSLGNPRNSRLFEVPFLQQLLESSMVTRVDLDFCQYGEPYKKPTSIFTSCSLLSTLSRHCNHRRHSTVLRGSERVMVEGKWTTQPKTRRAGAYPWMLVKEWAQVISQFLGLANRDSQIFEQQCEHELVTASQKTKDRRQSVQADAGFEELVTKLEQKSEKPLDQIVFGQHTNAEAHRRRSKAAKGIKQVEAEKIFSCRNPRSTSTTQAVESAQGQRSNLDPLPSSSEPLS